ncbi:MAG: hypothetical protein WAU42_03685 [Solirubrobacteraceae bacterium]
MSPRRQNAEITEPLSDDDSSAALAAAQQRIIEHPGFREKQLIDGLARTVYAVLVPNRDALLALLDQAATDANLAVELFQNVRRPAVRTRFEGAVMRGLLNYVASAMALVEHSRRITRGRSGPIAEEFERRKCETIENPEVLFIQHLRNYVLHRSLPFIGHEVHLQPRPGVLATSEIKLSVHELTGWDGWPAATKQFIASHGDAIPLRPIVRRHGDLVVELNLWLYEQLADANVPALEEANQLVVERNAILGGTDLEARRVTETWTRLRESPTLDPSVTAETLLPRRERSE